MNGKVSLKPQVLGILLGMVALLLFLSPSASATHIRAGDIIAQSDTTLPAATRNPFRFFFTMSIYLNTRSPIKELEVTIDNGDGTTRRVPQFRETPVDENTYRVTFRWSHTYPAGGTYRICWNGINRNEGILNISNSVNQTFYICTSITIDPLLGINRTPVLAVPPIDRACTGQVWVHNPGAFDADGDSISFKLRVPLRQETGAAVGQGVGPVPGYLTPDQVGAAGSFSLNQVTGQIIWNAPTVVGEYNIAFAIEEWRFGRKIGEVVRDMQILVLRCVNEPPVIAPIPDICVVAGTPVPRTIVTATDPDGHPILLTAISGIIPPAQFNIIRNVPGTAQGAFTWTPTCSDVREQPYQVIFRAQDIPPIPNPPLVALQPWNIRVVGPPPQNLQATVQNRNISLSWDPYVCQNAVRIQIYRREGSSGFVPDSCETGIPASAGYTKIADVPINSTQYLDTNNGMGLQRTSTYCYMIYATFSLPGGGESIASMEVCATPDANIPLLTNVSVEQTDATNGQMMVRWTQPRQGIEKLTPPFRYRLLRTEGQTNVATGFDEVVYETNNLQDTTFVDNNLNTLEQSYSYLLEFYHSAGAAGPTVLVDSPAVASSVRLAVTGDEANPAVINLSWTYRVPWDNSLLQHYIYRRIGDNFVLIDSVAAGATSGTYVDNGSFQNLGLPQSTEYCYYVTTQGTYGNPDLPNNLLNDSQQSCFFLTDRNPPCPPFLAINPLVCDDNYDPTPPLTNQLTWVLDTDPTCDQGVAFFTLYFRPTSEGDFTELVTVPDLSYLHGGLITTAGCYVVTATDSLGNESAYSNVVCKDACDRFILPNIFTPNGDNFNEVFRPDNRSVRVQAVRFEVFNRWGTKVYESTDDPLINWTGVNSNGQPLSDGVYYYLAVVDFFTLDPAGSRKSFKGWVEIVR